MAILSATELKTSREAIEAGVSAVSDGVADSAIALAEAVMNKALGYKVANGATTLTVGAAEGERLVLSERVRSISAITDAIAGGTQAPVTDTYEIRGGGFAVWRRARWRGDSTVVITGAFGFASTDDEYIIAKQFVLLYAVRYLQRTSTTNAMPTPPGAHLTGFASEKAQFTFFTPDGSLTGYQDLDIMLQQIGVHPNRQGGLYTITISRGDSGFSVEDVFAGREVPEQ